MTEAVYSLVAERINDLRDKRLLTSKHSRKWARRAARKLSSGLPRLSSTDIQNAAAAHSGAPLAIFLGIMLDGIPESLVLGASSLEAGLSISLIAGLFLSNFPEALSSSDGMAENGMKHTTIMSMWLFLMLFTGFGAWMGSIFFAGAPPFAFALIEGLAAGAMLTMIAETMLPEAFHKGGAITGIATLLGFLTAVFFKTFE
jgi:zinc transporter ZupT